MYDINNLLNKIWEEPNRLFSINFRYRSSGVYGRWESNQKLNGEQTPKTDKTKLERLSSGVIMVYYNGSSFPNKQSIWEYLKREYSTNDMLVVYTNVASIYNVEVDLSNYSREHRERVAKQVTEQPIISEIAKYLIKQLNEPTGQGARTYLEKRQLEATERIGAYSSEIKKGLQQHLIKVFPDNSTEQIIELIDRVLTKASADDYNLVLPYYNGRLVVGFCLRKTTDKESYIDYKGEEKILPKYLYSKGLEKGGYCGELSNKEPVIMVEGGLDAERIKQAGFSNVLCLGGSTIVGNTSEESANKNQILTLKRYGVKHLIYVPDYEKDKSGKVKTEATKNTIKAILPYLTGVMEEQGFNSLKIANLNIERENIKDADDLIRETSPGVFKMVLDEAVTWWEWEIQNSIDTLIGEDLQAAAVKIYTKITNPLDKERFKQQIEKGQYPQLKEVGINSAALAIIDKKGTATIYREKIKAISGELSAAIDKNATAEDIAEIIKKASKLQTADKQSKFSSHMIADRGYLEQLVFNKPEEIKTGWDLYIQKPVPRGVNTKKCVKTRNISFSAGYYSVVAAPTGYGKTSFMIGTAVRLAEETKKRFIYVAIEEDVEQLYIRALTTYIGNQNCVNWTKYDDNTTNPRGEIRGIIRDNVNTALNDDMPIARTKTGEVIEHLTQLYWENIAPYLKLTYCSSGEIEEICSNISAQVEKWKEEDIEVGGVFLDYLQLLHASGKAYTRTEELFAICNKINALAKETGLAFIIGAQLNRQATIAGGHGFDGVELANIGDSTGIERTAADVYLIWDTNRIKAPEGKEGDRYKRCCNDEGVIQNKLYVENLKARLYRTGGYCLIDWDAATGAISKTSEK